MSITATEAVTVTAIVTVSEIEIVIVIVIVIGIGPAVAETSATRITTRRDPEAMVIVSAEGTAPDPRCRVGVAAVAAAGSVGIRAHAGTGEIGPSL